MSIRTWLVIATVLVFGFIASGCGSPNPQLLAMTPIPTLAPGAVPTLLAVLQMAPASSSTASPVVGPESPAMGASIFLQNCTPCHGVQGQGTSAPQLRNSQYIQTAGNAAIFTTIADGRSSTQMPAWLQTNGGPLSEPQINDVIAYLHTLQNVSTLPTATPMPPQPTATPRPPTAPTAAPARPSLPGDPGVAVTLVGNAARGKTFFGQFCAACHGPQGVQGIANPGSDDGSVPGLNPIDPTLANTNPKLFAANVDLFVEHGSVPAGPAPLLMMPTFGDSKMLTNQQIADLIAYVMSLNSVK
jgi:mono/diheme cytochrome c family protein